MLTPRSKKVYEDLYALYTKIESIMLCKENELKNISHKMDVINHEVDIYYNNHLQDSNEIDNRADMWGYKMEIADNSNDIKTFIESIMTRFTLIEYEIFCITPNKKNNWSDVVRDMIDEINTESAIDLHDVVYFSDEDYERKIAEITNEINILEQDILRVESYMLSSISKIESDWIKLKSCAIIL